MARRKGGGKSFSVSVEGLSAFADMPGFIERGQRSMLDTGTKNLAAEVARKAPGGPTGKAGRDVEGRALTSTTGVVRSKGFGGARALERGAVIRPKKGKALHLHNGFFVRGKVVIKGRFYWKKGLRGRSKIIRAAYHGAFDDVTRNG